MEKKKNNNPGDGKIKKKICLKPLMVTTAAFISLKNSNIVSITSITF